jgi:hypothetical protein
VTKLRAKQALVIKTAEQVLRKRDEEHMVKNKPKGTVTEFPVGSYVLVEYPGGEIPNKSWMPRRGPLQVVKIEGNKQYSLLDLVSGKTERVDISRLIPFRYDQARTDPSEVAAREKKEYRTERIYDHRGDPKRKSTLEFKVHWLGYPDSADTWEPWDAENLGRNPHLHEYMYTQDELLTHIPREFRRDDHRELVKQSLARRRERQRE